MNQKRGQITIFIILGLVILVIVGLAFFVASIQQQALGIEAQQALEQSVDLYPPQKFVDYCVRYHVPLLIQKMAKSGGTQFPNDHEYISHKGSDVRLWYTQQNGNAVITKKEFSDELADSLPFVMRNCLDLKVYEQQGYEVSAGSLVIQNVTMNDRSLIVSLDFPLRLQKGDEIFEGSQYVIEYPFAFGQYFDLAVDLVNAYVNEEYVDTVMLMELYDGEVFIQRDRPYPYTVYSMDITLDGYPITFSFALEEQDVFGVEYPAPSGCCFAQRSCYGGVSRSKCEMQQGLFQQSACSCPSLLVDNQQDQDNRSEQSIVPAPVNFVDCGSAAHGDAWCAHTNGVGGRFTKEFCFNGTVHQDTCKDFRQEICVEDTDDSKSVAQCRPNVYASCTACKDESCCTDRLMHDCSWISDAVGCRPAVTPGLPFWRSDSAVQCSSASVFCTDCVLNSEEAIAGCVQMGDCGNQINVYGEQGTASIAGNIVGDDQGISLDFAQDVQTLSFQTPRGARGQSFESQQQSISVLLTTAIQTLDDLSQVSLTDYLNPFKQVDVGHAQVAYCQQWQPPQQGLCSYCMNAQTPCSEYLCKSMGERCVFANVNGSGFCFERPVQQESVPQIIDVVSNNEAQLRKTSMFGMQGYVVVDELSTQKALNLNVTLDTPSRCKLSYLPGKTFDSISGIELSNAEFLHEQQILLSFVSNFEVVERFLDVFEAASYTDLVDKLVVFKSQLENLAKEYPLVARFKTGYYPLIAPLVDHYLSAESSEVLTYLLDEFEEGRYYLFLVCMDDAGAQNEETFVSFSFQNICEDKQPPKIVDATLKEDGALRVVTNEYAQCRYDLQQVSFEEMQGIMDCPVSIYDVDVLTNTYACVADTNHSQNVYVACADNPQWILGEPLAFVVNAQASDLGLAFEEVSLDGRDVLEVNSSLLQSTSLTIFLDGRYECSTGNQSLACSDTSCQLFIDGINQYDVRCLPKIDRVCEDQQYNVVRQYVEYEQQEELDIFALRYLEDEQSVMVQVRDGDLRGASCVVTYESYASDFVQQNNQTYKAEVAEFPLGRIDATVRCVDTSGGETQKAIRMLR